MLIIKSGGCFNPHRVQGLVASYDASNPENNGTWPADGSPLGVWIDLSGTGNGAVAGGAVNPLFYRNITNGQPGLLFNGSSSYFQIADNSSLDFSSNGFTVFLVAKPLVDTNAAVVSKRDAALDTAYQLSTIVPTFGMQYCQSTAVCHYSNVTFAANQVHLFVWAMNSLQGNMYMDGANVFTAAGDYRPTNLASSDVYLGSVRGGANFFNGYFHRLDIFNVDVGLSNRLALEEYYRRRYAIY